MCRLLFIIFFPIVALTAEAGGGFDPRRDTPDYANETVFAYEGRPEVTAKSDSPGTEDRKYRRRCFVMVKGVLQFWNFAKFEPQLGKLSRDDYEKRVIQICHTPPWSKRTERVSLPGYADLRAFSEDHGDLLRKHMGLWIPTYARFGNMRVMNPSFPAGRQACADWLYAKVNAGQPCGLFISKLPGMIHAVLPYRVKSDANGDYVFTVYDPNLLDSTRELRFVRENQTFHYEPTFYFRGGGVNALRIYISPFH